MIARNWNPLSLCLMFVLAACLSDAQADTFGSGANSFEIEFVPIYNPDGPAGEHGCGRGCSGVVPGNPPDNTWPGNIGSVAYHYRMGKYEISEQMIDMANEAGGLGITHDARGPDKPATSITWFEAAKFVNWLNTNTGHTPAYKFVEVPHPIRPDFFPPTIEFALWEPNDAGYNPNNLFRNRLARYFLPSADEWYKAAYYDPTTPTGTWYNYATGSDAPPTAVASGTDPGTAVYQQELSAGPADIFNAGGLSPYGTMGQGGNVHEWEETALDLVNDDAFEMRGRRGGMWEFSALSAQFRFAAEPSNQNLGIGFRVASVIPEPSATVLVATALLGIQYMRRKSLVN